MNFTEEKFKALAHSSYDQGANDSMASLRDGLVVLKAQGVEEVKVDDLIVLIDSAIVVQQQVSAKVFAGD